MTKSKKRYMSMTDVKRLVSRWFDERVEIKNGATLKTTDGRDDFLKWLKGQRDRGDIAGYQWRRAMEQKRFNLEKDGRDWLLHGIKLKQPPEKGGIKTQETRSLINRWFKEHVELDRNAVTRNNDAFRNLQPKRRHQQGRLRLDQEKPGQRGRRGYIDQGKILGST